MRFLEFMWDANWIDVPAVETYVNCAITVLVFVGTPLCT